MELKGARILVMGGTGFLGSHLVERCLAENAFVRVFSTGMSINNIQHLLNNPHLSIIRGNLTDSACLDETVKGIDLVFHLAAFTKTTETYYGQLKDFQINVLGTLLLLEAMRKHDVKKIVFASTGKVYGKPQYLPVDESHPINPEDPYSLGKYVCEKYLELYFKLFNIDYIILRIFGIYGPRQVPKTGSLVGVISIFVDNILKGEDITIYGDGQLKKDFLYIDDFIEICTLLLHLDLWRNTFNIASSRVVTLNKLIRILAQKLETYKFKVNFKEPLKSDVDLCPDVGFLKTKTNYEPKVNLEEGIERYIHWYKQRLIYGSSTVQSL